jgi:hypothetical protein
MTVQQTTRNATLEDLAKLLQEQQLAKLDLVVPATSIHSRNGQWIVDGADTEPSIDPDGNLGMRPVPGTFVPTAVADEHAATKLGIPLQYLRRMRTDRPDLYDANVNGWLHGRTKVTAEGREVVAPPDPRKFLARTFRGNGGPGVLRALVSDRFRTIDNLDVLVAALDGVRDAGATVTIDGCDLTDRRMYVRIVAPQVKALAPVLLANYRSPWGNGNPAPWMTEAGRAHGYLSPDEAPVVFAGFVISNSETGGGAFTITPRILVKICNNGLVITVDALREVHLGGKLEEGVVEWSDDTNRKALELVTAKAKDAVTTFINPGYLERKVEEFTAKAGVPITDTTRAVEVVTNRLRLSEATGKAVLDHFIRGGQLTLGGVAQAVSSVAQVTTDADDAADLEASAVKVLDLAGVLA